MPRNSNVKSSRTHSHLERACPADVAAGSGISTSQNGSARAYFHVGVNGAGKTTSIGKLATGFARKAAASCSAPQTRSRRRPSSSSKSGAAHSIEVIKQKSGAVPAAVVYDAVAAARHAWPMSLSSIPRAPAHQIHLMAELEKMKRTAAK